MIEQHQVPTVMFADIPDDEAQYWTSKLEWINTMSIDEEVKTKNHSVFPAGSVPPLVTALLCPPVPSAGPESPAPVCCLPVL